MILYPSIAILAGLAWFLIKRYENRIQTYGLNVSIEKQDHRNRGLRWWHAIVVTKQRFRVINGAPVNGCLIDLEFLTPTGNLVYRYAGNWTTNYGPQHSIRLDVNERHPVPLVVRSLMPTIAYAEIQPDIAYVTDELFLTQRAPSFLLNPGSYVVRVSVRLERSILATKRFTLYVPIAGIEQFVLNAVD